MTIRVYPTGIASEAWRVARDGEHLADIRLEIHATGRGNYWITRPDRPDLGLWAQLAQDGTFTFDVWDRAAVRGVLVALVHGRDPGAQVTVEIKRPTR